MYKIAILFANYGPYHIARVKSAYHTLQSKNWEVFGIELARSEEEYPWQAPIDQADVKIYSIIDNLAVEKVKFADLFRQLITTLNKTSPDVVAIAGYARPSMLVVLFWSLWYRKIVILLSDSKEDDEPRKWWREKLKGWLVSRYKAALVAGQPHKRYLTKLGMPEYTIFMGYDVVDNNTFHPQKIRTLPVPTKRPFFLAINRFVSKKNLLFLIAAYSQYRQQSQDTAWDLVLCGDGELRSQIEHNIVSLHLQNDIYLTGFLQQDELLPYFAHAGCFIHASTQEQWGLVVNEAMAAGLPVLLSNRCGCVEDLLIEGVNGLSFDPYKPEELTRLMLRMSSNDVDREAMGKAALQHIQKFSPSYFANGLIQAIEYTQQSRLLKQ